VSECRWTVIPVVVCVGVNSFEEGGKLLCLLVQHVGKTIDICEEVKYNEDDKLDKLRTVHRELKEDYLIQHLRRYGCCMII